MVSMWIHECVGLGSAGEFVLSGHGRLEDEMGAMTEIVAQTERDLGVGQIPA